MMRACLELTNEDNRNWEVSALIKVSERDEVFRHQVMDHATRSPTNTKAWLISTVPRYRAIVQCFGKNAAFFNW